MRPKLKIIAINKRDKKKEKIMSKYLNYLFKDDGWEKKVEIYIKDILEDEFYGESEVQFAKRMEIATGLILYIHTLIAQAEIEGIKKGKKEQKKYDKTH